MQRIIDDTFTELFGPDPVPQSAFLRGIETRRKALSVSVADYLEGTGLSAERYHRFLTGEIMPDVYWDKLKTRIVLLELLN